MIAGRALSAATVLASEHAIYDDSKTKAVKQDHTRPLMYSDRLAPLLTNWNIEKPPRRMMRSVDSDVAYETSA